MSIFGKELNLEEVNTMLKESMESTNMIRNKLPMKMFLMAQESYERQQKEQEIVNQMYSKNQQYVTKITMIDEDSAIIETFEKIFGDEALTWYRTYHKGHIDSSVTGSFDIALLQLVAVRNGNEGATRYMAKLIDLVERND